MTGEFLLEIGTEEIPARFLPPTMEQMKESMKTKLDEISLSFQSLETMATPRRLTLLVSGLLLKQKDQDQCIVGPPVRASFDEDGNPTKAAMGFARAHDVDVSLLRRVDSKRGPCVAIIRRIYGKSSMELLGEFLPAWITSLSFPKSMRWGTSRISFARPIHWILALLDGKVIPFELDRIHSGSLTYGHRFMAPGPIPVRSFGEYISNLNAAHVIVNPSERRKLMEESVHKVALEYQGKILEDPQLLLENSFLVEYPHPACGSFDKKFLVLPKEVLITAMREHQRYFAVEDAEGNLMPLFVAVNNTAPRNDKVVTSGHERVLKARLEDARFFFNKDRNKTLPEHLEELKGVLFQKRLGTSYQKMERFRSLALFMADTLCPGEKAVVEQTATLCKADLVTEMVGEFPSLQGIMGRSYARLSGISEEVAAAIFEHYLPRFSDDALPTSAAGALVGIADRLDTICGCFGIGLLPTGAADPYALRRHTLAIIHILLHKDYRLNLRAAVVKSLELLNDRLERSAGEVEEDVLSFFRARLHNLMTGKGFPHDVVDAVLSVHFQVPPEAVGRIEALNEWRSRPEFEALAISFKRVVNILKNQTLDEQISPELLEDPAEKELWEAFGQARERVNGLIGEKDYRGALEVIFRLKGPIDFFFDTVLVMTDRSDLRTNRLNLLHGLGALFRTIGDFSKFAV